MGSWWRRSSVIAHHIRAKMGLRGSAANINQASSWSHPFQSDYSTLIPPSFPCNIIATLFSVGRLKSTVTGKQLDSLHVTHNDDDDDDDDDQALDFPGGKVSYTSEMKFILGCSDKRIPCYRVLDGDGEQIRGSDFQQVNKELAVKMYSDMVTLQMMDTLFYEAQRQGRISFYLTSFGEEAINIASAAALSKDDIVLPQYREPGVLLWRGFTLQEFANQCFGNNADDGKGRQMPIHYGSSKHNFITVSSPIATQLPQAAGMAYSLKIDKKDACAVAFIGDGGTSEGDFHAGLNFAAVLEAPVIFVCRNNGWAISTPISEQFRSDGIVVKGKAYGIPSIRVDGTDALAVYGAIHAARDMAINVQGPVLVETLAYRVGHHSTSDDSTEYRPLGEIEYWKTVRNPVNKFRKWVEISGWWTERDEAELRRSIKKQLLQAIQVAEKTEKPPLAELFADVYDLPPSNLIEQEKQLRETINKYPQDFSSDVSL
ncbi:2-oxoisovalerate dehydrogenase subunit alpha 1, mitochondrial-like isoform X2 [Herrania umbratica]|uniref:3-methyl-2-oxobutanoate dehydrogenase (2-methylpropanoyl-transferring) n=1 Tax=Herrania umbratica TaxID=108875 RepID=A0A6J1AD64_9ROSI|nr:2-oxoisovalerate dehydrogenase subunit alpha 1, mitochondrial-like isoform X2 [Herrania umbratica]